MFPSIFVCTFPLNRLKEKIGRGKWLLWLPANFPELGSTDSARTETASRCMRFFKDNPPKIGNSRFSKPPAEFSADSKRSFMWRYVPAKERLLLEGDAKITPAPHHLTFVNEFFGTIDSCGSAKLNTSILTCSAAR